MTAHLPFALQKRGSNLLNQQCWLWGHDVRRAEGNLLLELGFQRQRPPAGQQGCSEYKRHCSGSELRLWGFGFYYCDSRGGLYLNRFVFAPQSVVLYEAVWTAGDLPDKAVAAECSAAAAAVRAVAALEHETQQQAGLAYRTRCLFGWNKRALPPADLIPAWLALAHDIESHAARARGRRPVQTQTGLRCVQRPIGAV